MTLAVNEKIDELYILIKENKTLAFSWLIHILSVGIAGAVLMLGLLLRYQRKKRVIELSIKLEKIIVYSAIGINLAIVLLYALSTFYLSEVSTSIDRCIDHYEANLTFNDLPMCNEVCYYMSA